MMKNFIKKPIIAAILGLLAILLSTAIIFSILAAILMVLWNLVIVTIFPSLPTLSIWLALGLAVFLRLIVLLLKD